jgi:hypothetical protein
MSETVVKIVEENGNKTKTTFNIDAIGIEYFDHLKKDDVIPGVTYLRHADPIGKAKFINERMAAVGDVTFSLPNPGNPRENIELLIERAEAIQVGVDDDPSALPATMLKLLCNIPMADLEQLLIYGQLKFVRTNGQ